MTSAYDEDLNLVNLEEFYGPGKASGYHLTTPGIDFSQGFGHVRTANVLGLLQEYDTYLYEDIMVEYSCWFYFIVTGETKISITLVWSDPPGSYDCAANDICLIHDLDSGFTWSHSS